MIAENLEFTDQVEKIIESDVFIVSVPTPIDEAKSVVESVKEYGKIVRPLLGVRYNEINPLLDGPISMTEIRGKRMIPGDIHTAKFIAFDSTDLPEPGRA